MKVGDNIEFNYLKGYDCDLLKGILTKDYSSKAEAYSGKVVEIRDIEKHPVSNVTLRYGKIKGERSRNLVTVEDSDGFAKALYDGRMIGLKIS